MTQHAAERPINRSTVRAKIENLLTSRFYKTDFDAMDRMNLDPVRRERNEVPDDARLAPGW